MFSFFFLFFNILLHFFTFSYILFELFLALTLCWPSLSSLDIHSGFRCRCQVTLPPPAQPAVLFCQFSAVPKNILVCHWHSLAKAKFEEPEFWPMPRSLFWMTVELKITVVSLNFMFCHNLHRYIFLVEKHLAKINFTHRCFQPSSWQPWLGDSSICGNLATSYCHCWKI